MSAKASAGNNEDQCVLETSGQPAHIRRRHPRRFHPSQYQIYKTVPHNYTDSIMFQNSNVFREEMENWIMAQLLLIFVYQTTDKNEKYKIRLSEYTNKKLENQAYSP
jgi:hypothetical protein